MSQEQLPGMNDDEWSGLLQQDPGKAVSSRPDAPLRGKKADECRDCHQPTVWRYDPKRQKRMQFDPGPRGGYHWETCQSENAERIRIRSGKAEGIFPISYSRLNLWRRCPWAYWRRYVLREPEIRGPLMELGSAVHRYGELKMKGLEPELPPIPLEVVGDYVRLTRAFDSIEWDLEDLYGLEETMRLRWDDPSGKIVELEGKLDFLIDDGVIATDTDWKGLALDTPLPTPTGWTTMGDVQPGDRLVDAGGYPVNVVAKSAVKRIGTYVVRFDTGDEIVCDREHLWWAAVGLEYRPYVRPVTELASLNVEGVQIKVPVSNSMVLPAAKLPIEPYLLGCWLGDGRTRDGTISKGPDLFEVIAEAGHELGIEQAGSVALRTTRTVIGLKPKLRQADLLHNKRIPAAYQRASHEQRVALLQGLMDTNGTWNRDRNRANFSSCDVGLAEDVRDLLLTLGQRPHLASIQRCGFDKTVTSYEVEFAPVMLQPFRLPRKRDRVELGPQAGLRSTWRWIRSIQPGPDVETACVAVDSPTHTYLCGRGLIPTHNSGFAKPTFWELRKDLEAQTHCLLVYRNLPLREKYVFRIVLLRILDPSGRPTVVEVDYTPEHLEEFQKALQADVSKLIQMHADDVWPPNPMCETCPPGAHPQAAEDLFKPITINMTNGTFEVPPLKPPATAEERVKLAAATHLASLLAKAGRDALRASCKDNPPIEIGDVELGYFPYESKSVSDIEAAITIIKAAGLPLNRFFNLNMTAAKPLLNEEGKRYEPALAALLKTETKTRFGFQKKGGEPSLAEWAERFREGDIAEVIELTVGGTEE